MVLALASSGIHSNGFSLVRKLVADAGLALDEPVPFDNGTSLGRALLAPTRIYVKSLLAAVRQTGAVKAMAHITGGGITENLPRVLPESLAARIDLDRLPVPPVFRWLAGLADIAPDEMLRTFNCGAGMMLVVPSASVAAVTAALTASGETVVAVGEIAERDDGPVAYSGTTGPQPAMTERKRVAILISGRGSNMGALIRAAAQPDYPAEIVLVLSSRSDAAGLAKAAEAGIATAIVSSKEIKDRAGIRGRHRRAPQGGPNRHRLSRRLHAASVGGFRRALARSRDQHPPVDPALLPGAQHP